MPAPTLPVNNSVLFDGKSAGLLPISTAARHS